MHPKNEALLTAIREAYNYKPQVPQQQPTNMPNVDTMGGVTGYSAGGSTTPFYDMSRLLIQKHLSGK
jgi:hypothetical protein